VRRVTLALVVALAAGLAGCGAFDPGIGDGGSVETVTPVPVPTTAQPSPPGVTDGTVDPAAVADAHRRTLRATNYTVSTRVRIENGSAALSVFRQTRRVAAGGERYAGEYGRNTSNPPVALSTRSVAYWTGGDGYASRHVEHGRVVYLGWSTTGEPITDVERARAARRVLSALSFTVAERGDDALVLTATGIRDRAALPRPRYVDGVHNVSARVRVGFDGVVSSSRLAYDARFADRRVRVSYETTVTDRGATTVERPAWVDEARNRSVA
jgi:hypothetical protein